MAAPNDPEIVRQVSELLARGDGQGACALCKSEFSGRTPTPAETLLFAESLFIAGRLQEAEDALRGLIRQGGMDAVVATGLADILGRTGRADEAVVLLREQEQSNPEDMAPSLALGIIQGRRAQAETDAGKRLLRCDEAQDSFDRAREKGGWDAAIATGLAALEILRKRQGNAHAILEEALEHLSEPGPRQLVLADLLLYRVIWGEREAAEQVASRLGFEANRAPAGFQPILLNLAAQARQMAHGDEEWQARALFFADILEGLRPD